MYFFNTVHMLGMPYSGVDLRLSMHISGVNPPFFVVGATSTYVWHIISGNLKVIKPSLSFQNIHVKNCINKGERRVSRLLPLVNNHFISNHLL